jgi:hypothetical protein
MSEEGIWPYTAPEEVKMILGVVLQVFTRSKRFFIASKFNEYISAGFVMFRDADAGVAA